MQDQGKDIPSEVKDIMAKKIDASAKVELIKELDARPQTDYGPYVNACINMADLKINSQDIGRLDDAQRQNVANLYVNRNKGTILGDVAMAIPRVLYQLSLAVIAVLVLISPYGAVIASGAAKNYHREEADNQINNQLNGGNYRYSAHETVTIQKASKYYNTSDKHKTLYQKATNKSEDIRKLVHKELDRRNKEAEGDKKHFGSAITQKEKNVAYLKKKIATGSQFITGFMGRKEKLQKENDKIGKLKKDIENLDKKIEAITQIKPVTNESDQTSGPKKS